MNLPEGAHITQIWPAVDGWRVLYACGPSLVEYPVIAWSLLETNTGQRVVGSYVRPHSIEVELGEPQWRGYLKPGEVLTESVIKGLLARAKHNVAEAEQAGPQTEYLSQEAWDLWERNFLFALKTLGLSARVYNRLVYTVSRAKSDDSLAAQFIHVDRASHVARLLTFEEWCRLAMQPDFRKRFRKIRNMGPTSYAELAQKCRAYLGTAINQEGETL